ncbi:hypothetical protein DSO57_1012563 [Entomophthora muscae]|uniref:Uncharacterized protein n=1 Tax=Entomophthora muscae TaxID=34485 RepID=A0ACC2TH85_9FUNG|nr:hypothetical protein DSO57_1012563 [Entomophthora muscae]
MSSYCARYHKATQGISNNTLELKVLLKELQQENTYLIRENQKNKELVDEANKIFSVVQGWQGLGTRRGPVTRRVITENPQVEFPDLMNEVVMKPTDETGTNQGDEADNQKQSLTETLEGTQTTIFLIPRKEQQEGKSRALSPATTNDWEVQSQPEYHPNQPEEQNNTNQPEGEDKPNQPRGLNPRCQGQASKELLRNNSLNESNLLHSKGTSKDRIWAHPREEQTVPNLNLFKDDIKASHQYKRDRNSGNVPTLPNNHANESSGNLEVVSSDEEEIPEKRVHKLSTPRTPNLVTYQEEEEVPNQVVDATLENAADQVKLARIRARSLGLKDKFKMTLKVLPPFQSSNPVTHIEALGPLALENISLENIHLVLDDEPMRDICQSHSPGWQPILPYY